MDTGESLSMMKNPKPTLKPYLMPLFSDIALQTDRLILSPLIQSDVAPFFAIQSDPEVMRYWNHAPWTEANQAEQSITQSMEAAANGTALTLAIRVADTREMIGTCLLFAIEKQSARGEIGYNLSRHAQGRGYMTEAMQRLIDFAFHDLQLRRLEAEIDPRNTASTRLLQRLGFQQEGLLRERWIVEGETSDSAIYGLLAKDRLLDTSS